MFSVLFQVSWKFNFSTEAIRNTSLEPNYRVALNRVRAYNPMSHVLYFCLHTSNTCKIFRIPTLYVNNLELDNNVKIRDKGRSLLGLFEFYFYLFFFSCFNAFSEVFSSLRQNRETHFARNLHKVPNLTGSMNYFMVVTYIPLPKAFIIHPILIQRLPLRV